MKPQIRFPLAFLLILGAYAVYRIGEYEVRRTGFEIFPIYVLAFVFFIAGLIVLFNKAHKIVPDDWMP